MTLLFFFLIIRPPPRPTLFPYTTLFRSRPEHGSQRPFHRLEHARQCRCLWRAAVELGNLTEIELLGDTQDRKSTRLNSSHSQNSYAVFCLKKKKNKKNDHVHPHEYVCTR